MKSWNRIGLSTRVILILALLTMITIGAGSVIIWYSGQVEALFTEMIDDDINDLMAAEELETALVNQKGFATYYILDEDPGWLKQLSYHRRSFEKWLKIARESTDNQNEIEILDKIGNHHSVYVELKDRVLALYKNGDRESGAELHREVRNIYFGVYDLCENYKDIQKASISSAREKSRAQAKRINTIAVVFMSMSIFLGTLMAFVLISQILIPIRKLTYKTAPGEGLNKSGNEVSTLSNQVNGLVENMDTARRQLEQSQERLVYSEKMANLGKLAAEAAHSIRNPMTSIIMRLFSLQRDLDLDDTQREDFEVVSEEMSRLDNIVANFLEFSKPPKLKTMEVDVSDILTMTLNLLQHRLQLKNVILTREPNRGIPKVEADPEMIKEVFVNLIGNACDAMTDGDKLTVTEKVAVSDQLGSVVMIEISDSGPGIPEEIHDKVMDPFFSTKPEGTGLGLAIAYRIVKEHGGQLEFWSVENQGATFTITLPIVEE